MRVVALGVIVSLTCGLLSPAYGEATGKKIRFGIQTVPEVADPADLIKLWQEAEAWGYDTAWTFDHFMPITGNTQGPCLDGWMLLGALAAKTSKIHRGVLVTGNTYRHPAVLAKMATTADHLSNGRLELGVGAGWFEAEHTAYGLPSIHPKNECSGWTKPCRLFVHCGRRKRPSFNGKYYQIKNAPFEPKPLRKPHPPILIGGQGEKWTLPIVAKQQERTPETNLAVHRCSHLYV